jgi:hypothetical protein
MRNNIPSLLTATLLLLVPLTGVAEPPADVQPPPPGGNTARRPSEHWLEAIRKKDPGEHRRLDRLRTESPDEFASELRKRIRARSVERLLEQNPRLREFLNTLPPEERESLSEALRQFAGVSRRFPGAHEIRQEPSRTRSREEQETPEAPATKGNSKPFRTLAEREAAYDRRTQMIESEVDRITRQLEKLRRLLEERKASRNRMINGQPVD